MFNAGHGNWWAFMGSDEKSAPRLDRALLLRVWEYARPYRWQTAVVLGLIGASTIVGLAPPLLMRQLLDTTLPTRDYGQLNLVALALVAVPLINGLLGVWQRNISARMGEDLICELRQSLYGHMQRMSLRFFTHTKTGEIMARLNNDVVGAQRAVTGTLVGTITNVIQALLTLGIMITLEWRLTVLSVVVLPLFILPARRVGGRLRELTQQGFEINAKMNALMNETLNVSGILLMKIFGRQPENFAQFRKRSQQVADIGVRSSIIGRWFFMGLGLISAVGTALVFWVGGHLVLQGTFTIGTIVAFASYLGGLYGPISSLANARVDLASSMVSFERVFEVLDLPVEISDRPAARALARPHGRVEFAAVGFRYQAAAPADGQQAAANGSHPAEIGARLKPQQRHGRHADPDAADYSVIANRTDALHEISFAIEAGQLAAVVGPSGAGKTTLTYLVPRLYDPTSGSIRLDGYDLRDLRLDTLANAIGMVTQETFLFHDTLRANLLYAKTDATMAELWAACEVAQLGDFVRSLPEKLETVVGERGYRLSGGEKQRVAIARAILKDPPILILDEATSSLDSQSEALIQQALKPLFKGRTSIVIAHRLSTILAADLILVLDHGRLVEQGKHATLLAQDGLYANLFRTQFERPLQYAAEASALEV